MENYKAGVEKEWRRQQGAEITDIESEIWHNYTPSCKMCNV